MRQVVITDHQLEMAGPRNIAYRPTIDEFLRPAARLAYQGNIAAALEAAEDAYVAKHGNMRGISFRVRTTTEILSGNGTHDRLVDGKG